ncbi:MAG: SLAC1 anion channel family protein [Gammaproteobacteria bacterium SHHR-1]|uniref:SLAC1 anion channel family protein n=1 Tax=Magnetovirga frankeli TaxID=947516 RepID=UPI0012936B49|nr:SLAC1 anion channel family protein [gamma proteobacterium SS-5]
MHLPERLQYFPISFFAMIMGLAGLSIAWRKAQQVLGISPALDSLVGLLAGLAFIALAGLYLGKFLNYPDAVEEELKHPIKLNFFPTISISLILLSVIALPYSHGLAAALWIVGSLLHLLLTQYVLNSWIHHEHYEIHHINPAWFIPVVGNVLIPITGMDLGYPEISWFFFSTGIIFWLVLFTIIFNRVLFHHPLPDRLMPTFFILIAPPAAGFIAYVKLNGDIDNFARVLYYGGLFLTLMFFTQGRRFVKLPFALSWWAYSFPIAAITIATLLMFERTGAEMFLYLGISLLALLSLIVCYLIYRTALAVRGGKICQPE